jgi:hypothetical protein
MTFVAVGCSKESATADQFRVYYEMLGDLEYDILFIAAKKVLCDRVYPTFPTVGELRQAALKVITAPTDITPIQAWEIGWNVIRNTDPEVSGSFDNACRRYGATPEVIRTIRAVGLASLCYGQEPIGVVRAQFMKAYEQLDTADKSRMLLPPRVNKSIDEIGKRNRDLPQLGKGES